MHIRIDPKKLGVAKKDLKRFKKQIPFAVAGMINDVAFKAKEGAHKDIPRYLKSPKPWIKKGVRVDKASKKKLRGRVYIPKDRWDAAMKWQVEGGTQQPQGRAHAVPARGTRRNAYGNVTPAQRASRLLQNEDKYFSGKPNNQPDLGAGVWQRMGKKRRGKLKMVHSYTGPTQYRARYPFYQRTVRTLKDNFAPAFKLRWGKAVASARR